MLGRGVERGVGEGASFFFSGMFEVELFKDTSAQWRGWNAGEDFSKKKAKQTPVLWVCGGF